MYGYAMKEQESLHYHPIAIIGEEEGAKVLG
ncbi:hypothetical protein J2129_001489 [Methanofollis sp. W23]|nr:hypothetical protein [Methanofollis sp. W23]